MIAFLIGFGAGLGVAFVGYLTFMAYLFVKGDE